MRAFVSELTRELAELDPGICMAFEQLVASGWSEVQVSRETFQIDILIEIVTDSQSVVIGIEDKIDASEQQNQIARYQQTLTWAFPRHTSILVFLTPGKRDPTTMDPTSRVRVLAVSYSSILAAVSAALQAKDLGLTDFCVLSELARHLREEVLEDTRIRELARELWRKHPRALQLALEYRPLLSEIQGVYEQFLRGKLGDDAKFDTYPEKGVSELKLELRSWFQAGVPVTFVLRSVKGNLQLRLLVWQKSFDEKHASLLEWAIRTNRAFPNLLDENFRTIHGWGVWHRVFMEEDYPDSSRIQATGCDEETVNEAGSRVLKMIEQLDPFIRDRA